MSELPPLSLYVHLPWCVRKCPYCDFNSHSAGNDPPFRRYLDALVRDISNESVRADNRVVESVFLGGGTPSLFEPSAIQRLLDACRSSLALAPDCEITMEANPGTVEHGSLRSYADAGVTRLSIGAQSFDERLLKVLGRIHGAADIRTTFREAEKAGFASVNLDLMFALPGQSPSEAVADLQAAIDLGPAHISWYQLTLEPNTVFHRRPPPGIPGDAEAWDMQVEGQHRLAAAGYEQYEVSAFARAGQCCRHNLNYWTFGDYLAVGAGAHGKVSRSPGQVIRYRKPANPTTFMEQVEGEAIDAGESLVPPTDLAFEFMLNALRLTSGVRHRLLAERTGVDPEAIAEVVEQAVVDGLLSDVDGEWRPTDNGFRFLNDLQARFLP